MLIWTIFNNVLIIMLQLIHEGNHVPQLQSTMNLMRLVWIGKLELNKKKAFCFTSDWMAKDLDSRKQLSECYKPTGNQDQE